MIIKTTIYKVKLFQTSNKKKYRKNKPVREKAPANAPHGKYEA
jgi:hypothetical protein